MSMTLNTMALKTVGIIEIPDAEGSEFDHGAFDPATRRIFVAHTGRDRIERERDVRLIAPGRDHARDAALVTRQREDGRHAAAARVAVDATHDDRFENALSGVGEVDAADRREVRTTGRCAHALAAAFVASAIAGRRRELHALGSALFGDRVRRFVPWRGPPRARARRAR